MPLDSVRSAASSDLRNAAAAVDAGVITAAQAVAVGSQGSTIRVHVARSLLIRAALLARRTAVPGASRVVSRRLADRVTELGTVALRRSAVALVGERRLAALVLVRGVV